MYLKYKYCYIISTFTDPFDQFMASSFSSLKKLYTYRK